MKAEQSCVWNRYCITHYRVAQVTCVHPFGMLLPFVMYKRNWATPSEGGGKGCCSRDRNIECCRKTGWNCIQIWNTVPVDVRQSETVRSFIIAMTTYSLHSEWFNRLLYMWKFIFLPYSYHTSLPKSTCVYGNLSTNPCFGLQYRAIPHAVPEVVRNYLAPNLTKLTV